MHGRLGRPGLLERGRKFRDRFTPQRLRETRVGQISILIVFSLIPMFSLFAFSVNIGMMVNAKIALQNATDLAAYAGAATEARRMTDISHLNYYMRMVYKKFLYKYYFLGNVALRCFPGRNDTTGKCHPSGADFNWINPTTAMDPGGGTTTTGTFPGVPIVCMSLSTMSNVCQLAVAVHVVQQTQCNQLDPSCGSLNAAAINIAASQLAACQKSSIVNQKVLGLWLYSTDYANQSTGTTVLDGFVNSDIGLITEEELTLQRILNIVDAIDNATTTGGAPVTNPPFTYTSAYTMLTNAPGGNDASPIEKSMLAFFTLYNGLNTNSVFDTGSISMTELLPKTRMLDVTPVGIDAQAAIGYMAPDGTAANAGCTMRIGSYTVKGSSPSGPELLNVGVQKSGRALVYYAIQASARAKLLFNPFPIGHPADDIPLTAYAAAMPFGSRIGPIFQNQGAMQTEFTRVGVPKDGDGQTPSALAEPGIPFNYPRLCMQGTAASCTISTENHLVLQNIYNTINGFVNSGNLVTAGNLPTTNTTIMQILQQLAFLPDIAEVGRYNIPVDAERNSAGSSAGYFYPYFVNRNGSAPSSSYTMWAPFSTSNNPKAFETAMTGLLDELHTLAGEVTADAGGLGGLGTSIDAALQELQNDANTGLQHLLSTDLYTGNGPSAPPMGVNVFRMPDPLGQAYWGQAGAPPCPANAASWGKVGCPLGGAPNSVTETLATSFSTLNDDGYNKAGRDGYSVRLISFQDLMTGGPLIGSAAGSVSSWTPPGLTGPAAVELKSLWH